MNRKTPLDYLLSDLCSQLGFCNAARDPDRFRELESQGADAYTDAVLDAEGLDPRLEEQLRRQVHELVSKYFAVAGLMHDGL